MENRTPDLRVANAALYQLSYDPDRGAVLSQGAGRLARAKPSAAEAVQPASFIKINQLEEFPAVDALLD